MTTRAVLHEHTKKQTAKRGVSFMTREFHVHQPHAVIPQDTPTPELKAKKRRRYALQSKSS
jgi:hypothetical protein